MFERIGPKDKKNGAGIPNVVFCLTLFDPRLCMSESISLARFLGKYLFLECPLSDRQKGILQDVSYCMVSQSNNVVSLMIKMFKIIEQSVTSFDSLHLDIDPCFGVECSYYAKCKAFGPKNATCVCNDEIPSYEEEVCSEEDVTYQNSFSLEQDSCLKGRRIRIKRPGSCQRKFVMCDQTSKQSN